MTNLLKYASGVVATTAPIILVIVAVAAIIILTNGFLKNRPETATKYATVRSLFLVFLILTGIVAIILMLPVAETARTSLLSVFGLIISAAITLSSTTFVGNAMAGIMLRALKNLNPGDFIEVEDHFGRVSELGILHTEIQTTDSNLTTLPNLFVVTKPMTVYRANGTLISAEVSLGYDISHKTVEKILLGAAEKTGLKDPFVQIMNLGDFSINYRCAGLLEDTKQIVSTRSALKANMLDCLHDGKVEIVSPNFMNQRVLEKEKVFIPDTIYATEETTEDSGPKDEIIFNKAEEAAKTDQTKKEIEEITVSLTDLEKELKGVKDEEQKKSIEAAISETRNRQSILEAEIQTSNTSEKEK